MKQSKMKQLLAILLSLSMLLIALPASAANGTDDKLMQGTWAFEYSEKGDGRAYITQNGNHFTGTYNKSAFWDLGPEGKGELAWVSGTIDGRIDGDAVYMTIHEDSYTPYQNRTITAMFTEEDWRFRFNRDTMCLTPYSFAEYRPNAKRHTTMIKHVESLNMYKIDDRVLTPTFTDPEMAMYSAGVVNPPSPCSTSEESVTKPTESEEPPEDVVQLTEISGEETQPVSSSAPEEVTINSGAAADTTKVHNGITGVTVKFDRTNAVGYRVYRSEDPNDIGISVSDFYITAPNFTDVNVEPNTTYYYTLREVAAEARPLEGIGEKPGRILAKWTVTTKSNIDEGFEPGATRHFIILTMNGPMMTVDGEEQEVDPGRGTTPINYKNRTMVPIRAVVEAMFGNAGWNGNTREISLAANGAKVQMWVDKKNIKVNGQDAKMDVTPLIKNGRTFTPIRFATENLNCKVDWLNSTNGIVIAWSDRD